MECCAAENGISSGWRMMGVLVPYLCQFPYGSRFGSGPFNVVYAEEEKKTPQAKTAKKVLKTGRNE